MPLFLYARMLSCFSHVQLFVTLWTVAQQAPLSMGFSRQEYWSAPFQTTQGNRISCRYQEARRGSDEAVPGLSVFPSIQRRNKIA